jgi:hypothetical protein
MSLISVWQTGITVTNASRDYIIGLRFFKNIYWYVIHLLQTTLCSHWNTFITLVFYRDCAIELCLPFILCNHCIVCNVNVCFVNSATVVDCRCYNASMTMCSIILCLLWRVPLLVCIGDEQLDDDDYYSQELPHLLIHLIYLFYVL